MKKDLELRDRFRKRIKNLKRQIVLIKINHKVWYMMMNSFLEKTSKLKIQNIQDKLEVKTIVLQNKVKNQFQ